MISAESLATEQSDLGVLYQYAPHAMLVINSERKVAELNQSALQMCNLDREQALGRYGGDLFRCQHAESGCGIGFECSQCLVNQNVLTSLLERKSRKDQVATLTTITPQGPVLKHLKISATPVDFADESMALVCIEDISELIQQLQYSDENEYRVQHFYRQFETLLNAIDDPIGLIDDNYDLLWANDSYRDLQQEIGCDHNGLIFRNYFTEPDSYPLQRCFASGKRVESDVATNDGRLWQLRSFPLSTGKDQQQALQIAIDISEKEQLREKAARSSRLASLGMLAAGVAHEINNPNAFIIYNSDILREIFTELLPYLHQQNPALESVEINGLSWSELEEEMPNMLSAIQEGAQRIKRIVADLRDYARGESNSSFKPIDLNSVADAAVRLVQNPLKNSTTSFSLELASDLPPVHGDFGRLEQVVINLLLNSCQALTSQDQAICLRTSQQQPGQVTLQVIDEGHGIPAEILQSITKPFTTTKGESGGTGLGLSVSSRIVKAHGGKLEFSSPPGEPTCVTLQLPVYTGEEQADV
ncbi:PAS fold-containing protein [Malonomonas rubra DSM 5091]|uniref:histidine kinase n=1 Tax=Malonomonas rubra DSM 5091 TaxID=1122189 RepID=A0A1M6IQK0_MALRU|nr:ATP-binding protein [Malonomonas rubra]SHJ36713.1 PAS fold-containing protein [Malonomonas rubra DSM 5091]